MLGAIAYSLQVLVPPLARFHARYSGALRLVAWQQQRGTKALRLPLLLAIVGLPLVTYFLGGRHGG